jgi:tryptophan-rich sensory protein
MLPATGRKACRIALCAAAAALAAGMCIASALFGNAWYREASKSLLDLPATVLSAGWGLTCLCVGACCALLCREGHHGKELRLLVMGTGLGLAALWNHLFFLKHNGAGAMIVLTVLAIIWGAMLPDTSKKDRTAAILLLPCLVWADLLMVMNYVHVMLN